MPIKNRMFRTRENYDRYDIDGNLDDISNSAVGRMLPVAAPGCSKVEATHDARTTDVADIKNVGRRSGAAPAAPFVYHSWERYTWEMDLIILNWYRSLNKSKAKISPGRKAKEIAEYLNKRFGTNLTANSIIGRYNRKLKYARTPRGDPEAVPTKAAATPSLPNLKFLRDES